MEHDQRELAEMLSCLYTDFLMLQDGEWIPDAHSITASIDSVERIARILNITPQDTRS